ncbi:MAG: TonB-dependent receptor plug domain-containing protein [Gammaproteobacteria bacterium]|nr:TonB-dependent receptor plug domain-containing protein [Gammaproteobacteria bacterium]
MKQNIKLSIFSLIAASLILTLDVYAQNEGGLEEIVVTAQKRSESLQEVPISIQVFSSDDIERLAVTNTIDLVRNVPGMVGVTNVGLPQAAAYFIRGIGQH